jgi:hypothetical protein
MKRTLLFSLVTLVLAALPFRLLGEEDEAHVQYTRSGSLSGVEPVVETYEVLPPMKRLEVRLSFALQAGGAAWELRDPQGKVRWNGTAKADSGTVEEEQKLDAVAGDWTLTIHPQGADGQYTLRWRGDS